MATEFVLAAGSEIADYYASSATWRLTVRGAGGFPLAEIVPGASDQIAYVHHDLQGSTVALTTAGSNGPSDTYTYSDYGQPQSGSWSAYQYAGYRYDSETGLYYVKARYYSPVLGRFMQSDPAGFRGGINLYAYTGNDPINFVDPLGLTKDGGSLLQSVKSFFSDLFSPPTPPSGASSAGSISSDDGGLFGALGVNGLQVMAMSSTMNLGFQQDFQDADDEEQLDEELQEADIENLGAANDVTFTHFTNAEGLTGITGANPANLSPGQNVTVNQLQFGTGQNSYLANEPGDNFVTDLSPTSSSLSLSQIGVFGDKQSFGISFSGQDAASQGVLVRGGGQPNIYTIPANTTLTGCFTVTCR